MSARTEISGRKERRFRDRWGAPLGALAGGILLVIGYAIMRHYDYLATDLDRLYALPDMLSLGAPTIEDFGATADTSGWTAAYNIVRFGLAAITVWAVGATFWKTLRFGIDRIRASYFSKGHIVLLGLGYRGFALLQRLVPNYRVVVLELDTKNPNIEKAQSLGAIVLLGDMTFERHLSDCGIRRASHIITCAETDEVNVAAGRIVQNLCEESSDKTPHILVRLDDLQVLNTLCAQDSTADHLEVYSMHEKALTLLLNRQRTWMPGPDGQTVPFSIAVIGDGDHAQLMVALIAKRWQAARSDRAARIRVLLVGPDAEARLAECTDMFPGIHKMADLDYFSTQVRCARSMAAAMREREVQVAYIVPQRSEDSVAIAVALRKESPAFRLGVRVDATESVRRFAGLPAPNDPALDASVVVVDGADPIVEPSALLDGVAESMARAAHEDYRLRKFYEMAHDPGAIATVAAAQEWDELQERFRRQNLDQADSIEESLAAVGYAVTSLLDWSAEEFEFSSEDIEDLANREHDRWINTFKGLGYRDDASLRGPRDTVWAGTVHDEKRSGYFVPFSELPDSIADYDREAVKNFPQMLSLVGKRPVPRGGSGCPGASMDSPVG